MNACEHYVAIIRSKRVCAMSLLSISEVVVVVVVVVNCILLFLSQVGNVFVVGREHAVGSDGRLIKEHNTKTKCISK